MKVLLVLAVLGTSASSFAANRAIYDVMYLPTARTVFGISQIDFGRGKILDQNSKTDVDSTTFSQTVGYSLMDNLSLSLDANYTKTSIEPGSPTTEIKGLSDPTVGAKYRLLDSTSRLDILVNAGISTGNAELKNNELNNKAGGNSLSAAAQYGAKTEDFQWAVLGGYKRNFESTLDALGSENDIDAHGTWSLRGDVLGKWSETMILRSFLSTEFVDTYDGDLGETSSWMKYTFGTEYQHICTANFLLRVGINYAFVKQDSIDQNDTWTLVGGANYQF